MTDDAIEPCPFPHEVKRGPFVERDDEDFFFVRVSCGDCGCAGPYVPLESEDGKPEEAHAIRLWNTRFKHSVPDELAKQIVDRSIERLRGLHDYAGRPAWDQVVAEEIRSALSTQVVERG